LAKRLGVSTGTLDNYIAGKHGQCILTGQQTSNLGASMALMKAAEHGFDDGDHLVIDGREYSSLEVREALLFVRETLEHCSGD
jgi:hypothetical protein